MKSIDPKQLRAMLEAGVLVEDPDSVVEEGQIIRSDYSTSDYQLHCGWDYSKAFSCDKHWGIFNMELMEYIRAQNYTDEELLDILPKLQLDDAHWDWLAKSLHHFTDEYIWFFLVSEGVPQGACLIKYPKKSAFEERNIFYIEYIATAPWNRINPMSERRFNGIGSILIKAAIKHAKSKLGLGCGFSLHALAKAISFYEKIGMLQEEKYDKPQLKYFEMLENTGAEYVEKK